MTYQHILATMKSPRMRAMLCAIFLSSIVAACGGGSLGEVSATLRIEGEATQTPTTQTCTVDLFGDSILRGEYWKYNPQVFTRLAEPPADTLRRLRPDYAIHDHTASGVSMQMLIDGYTPPFEDGASPRAAFAQYPRTGRVVVVENGVIDSWQNGANFPANLNAAISTIKAEGRKPVIAGFSKQAIKTGDQAYITQEMLTRRDSYNETAKSVAASTGSIFADMGLAEFSGASDIVDNVHPTKAYSDRLMNRLAVAIDQACQ